jgi:hypothetical protein
MKKVSARDDRLEISDKKSLIHLREPTALKGRKKTCGGISPGER